MDHDSDKGTNHAEAAERPLIDAAWSQFQTLAARRRPSASDASRTFAVPGYRVLGEIHRGGQGVVYQAVQESTRRKVAIKVLKEGTLADPTELARFDREVEVLSRLKHPHIVSIYDRGLIAGHAYYVMDYIPGRSLDAHVAGAALALRDVLGLFHKVCEAVNAAHLRGVIHRDLKPSNIRVDEEGEPHVLDFGLAKLAQDPSSSAGAMTVTGQFVGSLPWASPEQAEGRSELLDVRTDVYSLGVILYQLLTRSFPYPVSGRMTEVVQSILHTPPARPSALVRDLERDVEVILLKCLAKDPERRYQNAGELARDLRRYLNGEPIEARPATSVYQLHQFARRNKALVTSVIAVILILAAATAVSVAFGVSEGRQRKAAELDRVRAEEAELQAQMRADELEQVAKFQEAQLSGIDVQTMGLRLRAGLLKNARTAAERLKLAPEALNARIAELEMLIAGSDFTGLALQALDANVFQTALAAIGKQFADQPLVKARLLHTVAMTLRGLGLLEAATTPQQEALAIRRRVLGNDHPDTLASINQMGILLWTQGKLTEAEPYYQESLEGRQRVLGHEHPDTLESVSIMGGFLREQGKLAEAEPYCRAALESQRRVLGDEHPQTITSINNMGLLLRAQGKLSEAEPYYREALEKHRRVLGDEHPDTLSAINNMGILLQTRGRLSDAEPYYREALEKHHRVHGDEHPGTLGAINNVGFLLQAQGKLAEAEPYFRKALEKYRRLLGDLHPDTLILINNMGGILWAQAKLDEAETFLREALETRRRVLGAEHTSTLNSLNNMGMLLQAQGKLSDAEPHYREALETRRRILDEDHPDLLVSIHNLGYLMHAQGRLSEAEPYYREALDKRRRVLGDEHPDTLIAIASTGALLQAQGKPAETIELLLPAEAAARRAFTGGNAPRLGRLLTSLGCARAATGDFDAAETNLNESYAILSTAQGATQSDRIEALNGLVGLYESWHAAEPDKGHDQQVAKWRERLNQLSDK